MPSLPRRPGAAGSIRIERVDGGAVLHLTGEIDAAAVSDYDESPNRDRSVEGQVVAVDGSGLTFFSSIGLSLLLRVTEQTRESGRRPVILGAPRPLLRLLELTGLEALFTIDGGDGGPVDR